MKTGASVPIRRSTHTPTRKTRATAEAGTKKRPFYKPLPKEFRHDGFTFRQIARTKGTPRFTSKLGTGAITQVPVGK